MGENKSENGGGEKPNGNKVKRKKEETIIEVILKLNMHCEDCAAKIKKFVKSFPGVEMVKGGDGELAKLTVTGKVDPFKLREALEKKVKKKVELISPAPPKKDNNSEKENSMCKCNKGGDNENSGEKVEKLKEGEDEKKVKELEISITVMKMNLDCHCKGCIEKIRKIVRETKGYLDMSIDEGKELITVKGEIDTKTLIQSLSKKLKTKVEEIKPPKKEAEKKTKEKPKEEPKEKQKEKEKAKYNIDGDGNNKRTDDNQLIHYSDQNGYWNMPVYGYGNEYSVGYFPAPQMFSDENPNACSVM